MCVCIAVACPANSDGDDVPAGCGCNAGYSGSVTASTDAPFYESSCAGTVCLGSEIAARQHMFFLFICPSVCSCTWSFIMMVIIVDDYNDEVMVIMIYIFVYIDIYIYTIYISI